MSCSTAVSAIREGDGKLQELEQETDTRNGPSIPNPEGCGIIVCDSGGVAADQLSPLDPQPHR